MSQIKILPPDLVNKIAAGEVIERPASVVKELVENSIDAKASHITVEIQDAGKKLIRVTDDGGGMSDDEIRLALERHSTSKISSLDDLFNINTLGFRGEALPSIASVSELIISQNPSGKGLTVVVKAIFGSIPVRLKFLKSNFTEISRIQEVISRFVLSNPSIAFKLIIDGKESLSSSGNGKLFDAVFSIYGLDITRELIELKSVNIFGFVSKPTVSRLDRGYENFFVNNRIVQNFLLSRALEDAYRTLIPAGRYPIAVIFISVPQNEIDVNVHPSKREVKFLKTKEVMDSMRNAASSVLSSFVETRQWDTRGFGELGMGTKGYGNSDKLPNIQIPQSADPNNQITKYPQETDVIITDIQPLIPLYQLLDTYIICTDGVDLVLIDQHAAHERILYDKLGHKAQGTNFQSLLIPETLEFDKTDSLVVKENIPLLKELGFDIDEFGNDTYILRTVPSFLIKDASKELLSSMISEFKEQEFKTQPEKRHERINKFMACRGSVKAGDKLSQTEMQGLIRDLYKTENPSTCPHGRPTMVRITRDDLEKMFGRN